jgi:hypothetical protein
MSITDEKDHSTCTTQFKYQDQFITSIIEVEGNKTNELYSAKIDTISKTKYEIKVNNKQILSAFCDSLNRVVLITRGPDTEDKSKYFGAIFGEYHMFDITFRDSLSVKYEYLNKSLNYLEIFQSVGDIAPVITTLSERRNEKGQLIFRAIRFRTFDDSEHYISELIRDENNLILKNEIEERSYQIENDSIKVRVIDNNGNQRAYSYTAHK